METDFPDETVHEFQSAIHSLLLCTYNALVPSCTGNPLFTVTPAWLLSLRDASPLQGTRLHKEDYKFVLTKQFTITHFKCLLDIVLLYTFPKVTFQRQ